MDDVERGRCSLRKASVSWNIFWSSFFDHLNKKTRSRKMGLRDVLTKEEDVVLIKWTLNMQECGLSISLQQLKTKVAKLTQRIHHSEMEYQAIIGGGIGSSGNTHKRAFNNYKNWKFLEHMD
jgi:hypothetical protein